MIEFEDVTVKVGDRTLISDVRFSVKAGEKVVISGPTGCGKSTVLLALLGAHDICAGIARFDGLEVTPETLQSVRRSIAYIGQEPVIGDGTVRDALLLPFSFEANRDATPSDEDVAAALARLELDPGILDQPTNVVSGGEKQRVAIARALLLHKDVFLADEITSALDAASASVVLDLFLNSPYTVLAVSHDPEWQQRFATRIAMEAGRVVEVAR